MGAIVSRVEPGSIAARYGFKEQDQIITINGQLLKDILDYYFVTTEHKLEINYIRNGLPHSTIIHKKPEETLGLDFENEVFDGIKKCRYNCIFCFVDQQPSNLRKSLYVKDDDYRLSFLHRSYITLTDIAENDFRRITAMRLSPLYVSVHATDPSVRSEIMGSPGAGKILDMLKKLKEHDIQCHAQVVVIPGYNDGKVLRKTLQDLYNLGGTILSVAVVPVGFTKFRRKTRKLQNFKKSDAKQVYEIVTRFQEKARKRYRNPKFFMADEIYILLNKDFPSNSHYGYYPQLGNGVGMARLFITDFNRRKRYLPKEIKQQKRIWIITGSLGEKILKPLVTEINNTKRLRTRLITVKNHFLGPTVTVTGLLAGKDIIKKLKSEFKKGSKPDKILLPDILLRNGLFLDNITIEELKKEINVKVDVVQSNAAGLLHGVLETRKSRPKPERPERPKYHKRKMAETLDDVSEQATSYKERAQEIHNLTDSEKWMFNEFDEDEEKKEDRALQKPIKPQRDQKKNYRKNYGKKPYYKKRNNYKKNNSPKKSENSNTSDNKRNDNRPHRRKRRRPYRGAKNSTPAREAANDGGSK
ncbi:MAG: DUF512 domain-containing protein [Vulcanimicrobiota bacterium]